MASELPDIPYDTELQKQAAEQAKNLALLRPWSYCRTLQQPR
jgi:hypothetical protein